VQGLCHFVLCVLGIAVGEILVCLCVRWRSHVSRCLQSSACLFGQTGGGVLRSAHGDVSFSLVCLSGGESEVKVIERFLAIDAGTVLFL